MAEITQSPCPSGHSECIKTRAQPGRSHSQVSRAFAESGLMTSSVNTLSPSHWDPPSQLADHLGYQMARHMVIYFAVTKGIQIFLSLWSSASLKYFLSTCFWAPNPEKRHQPWALNLTWIIWLNPDCVFCVVLPAPLEMSEPRRGPVKGLVQSCTARTLPCNLTCPLDSRDDALSTMLSCFWAL